MKLTTALNLGRVSNLPTVWTNCIAGAVLSGASFAAGSGLGILLITTVAMTLSYVGGMFLNDAFDAKIDATEKPERPIPMGEVSRSEVFVWGFALLAGSVLVLLSGGSRGYSAAVAALVLAACIVLYNMWHKNNPLSPLIMGLCRVCVYVIAALALSQVIPAKVIVASLLILGYLIGLTYTAKQENLGSVQNMWPLLFLLAPLIYGLYGVFAANESPMLFSLILWLVLAAWTGYAVHLIKRRQPGDIPRAVVSLIAGISLVDALLVSLHGSIWLALLCCAGFAVTLLLQRYISGT